MNVTYVVFSSSSDSRLGKVGKHFYMTWTLACSLFQKGVAIITFYWIYHFDLWANCCKLLRLAPFCDLEFVQPHIWDFSARFPLLCTRSHLILWSVLIESLSKTLITTIPRPFPRAILYTLIWSVKYNFINLYLRITELNIDLFYFNFVITRTLRLVLYISFCYCCCCCSVWTGRGRE